MLRLRDLRLPPQKDGPKSLKRLAAQKLGLPDDRILELKIVRRSIDARKKNAVRLIYTLDAAIGDEEAYLRERGSGLLAPQEDGFAMPAPGRLPSARPAVAGFGPAGMFAALALAEAGLRPIVLERGMDVDTRRERLKAFLEKGILDEECNVQFGEGGAGTFSDGKLNTGTGGSSVGWILRRFAEFGADPAVTWDAAPHVGTDVLAVVVKRIRERIAALGGEVRFGTKLCGLEKRDGRITGAVVEKDGGRETVPCSALFLAVGHSARDTAELLLREGVPMEPKPFSMGVRIEHLQADIDRIQYGPYAGSRALGPAPYKLSVHLPDGTGVYTFCMCPGGYVIPAASQQGGVVTNGMSYSGRAGKNANAALLASLQPGQFPYPGPLGGMYWQRELEQRAYRLGGGGYAAPAQLAGDLLAGLPSAGPGSVQPTYARGVRWCGLDELFPGVILDPIRQALPALDRKMPGFAARDAVLTGPETRSSSPVRILRTGELQAVGLQGLYPCGEGAGWAGGIVSAAADALRCCEAYIRSL